MLRLAFFHGLESGPHGTKYEALQSLPLGVQAPDFRFAPTLDQRMAIARAWLGSDPAFIVGSSFGGLVAARLAQEHPDLVRGYLLCAPAVHTPEGKAIQTVPHHAAILHGLNDDVIPIHESRDFAAKFGIPLVQVIDDHRLTQSLDWMVALTNLLYTKTMLAK